MLLERITIRYWMNFDLFHTDDIRVEHCDGTRRGVQQVLDACREERRPYLVTTPHNLSGVPESTPPHEGEVGRGLTSILVPITMLEEEVYKAEICTYLARKTGAHLILLRANDYGSKARSNTQRIITHIQTIAERTGERITYEERIAKGDSFHIHKELHQLREGNEPWERKFEGKSRLYEQELHIRPDGWTRLHRVPKSDTSSRIHKVDADGAGGK